MAVFAAQNESEDDLVEFRWVYLGYPLRLVAGLNAQRFDFPLSPPGPARLEKAKALVTAVITDTDYWENEHYPTELQWPPTLEDGVTFSSNPEAPIHQLSAWFRRIDAFVEHDRLSILIYTKSEQRWGFQDGSRWFPEDFRQLVQRKAAGETILSEARAYDRSLDFGLTLIKDCPAKDFVALSWSDFPQFTFSSDLFFLPPATRSKLHTPGFLVRRNSHRVFTAQDDGQDDLVECVYVLDGHELRYVASRNAVKLEIDLGKIEDQCSDRARVECVKELVGKLIWLQGTDVWDRLEYDIQLPWPRDLVDRVQICSNSEKSFRRLYAWHERVDAFVQGKTLSILLYKRIPKDTQWLDGSKWFNDAFRHAVLQRSRE